MQKENNNRSSGLRWPQELSPTLAVQYQAWSDAGANQVLDFHGSPLNPDLVLFSDGNHHMALMQAVQSFERQHSVSVFYLTLPPGVLLQIIKNNGLCLGNLCFPLQPDVFIGPDFYINKVAEQRDLRAMNKFASSAGCSFLHRKGEAIFNNGVPPIEKLLDSGLKMFISHPQKEKASYDVYYQTFINLSLKQGIDKSRIEQWLQSIVGQGGQHVVSGQDVHHREAPATIAAGQADFSLIYHHLALRYTRIFPETFEMATVDGSGTGNIDNTQVCTDYFITTLQQATPKAQQFFDYMQGSEVAAIYREHGLLA